MFNRVKDFYIVMGGLLSKMKLFVKIGNDRKRPTIFTNMFIVDVKLGCIS